MSTRSSQGMKSLDQPEQNLEVARGFTPMTDAEQNDLALRAATAAAAGAFELFKTSGYFDANEGRVAHDFELQGVS